MFAVFVCVIGALLVLDACAKANDRWKGDR